MSVTVLKKYVDDRGALTPLDFREIPFVPKRVFWITGVPKGATRGRHAHYIEEQYFICIKGRILVTLGNNKETLEEGSCIHIPSNTYGSQEYLEEDSIALVITSTPYNKKDYK